LADIIEGQTLPSDLLKRASRKECSLEVLLRPYQTPYLLTLSPIFSESRQARLAGTLHDLSDQKRQQAALQKGYTDMQVLHRRLEDLNAQLEQKVEERTHTLSEAFQQLEEQNRQLQELDQLKSDFVSMVSHELRTPLTSLNGGLELLLLQQERSASDHSTLILMKQEVERLTRFVDSILNLSAVEAGRIQLSLQPVSLEDVLATVYSKFGANSEARQIRISLPPDCGPVLADRGILESVLITCLTMP